MHPLGASDKNRLQKVRGDLKVLDLQLAQKSATFEGSCLLCVVAFTGKNKKCSFCAGA